MYFLGYLLGEILSSTQTAAIFSDQDISDLISSRASDYKVFIEFISYHETNEWGCNFSDLKLHTIMELFV